MWHRLRRAPNVGHDNPATGADGLRTDDQADVFSGAMDRYQWKLLGKREMIVPANSYRLHSDAQTYVDILRKHHIDQNLTRYERRRVWVVEAHLRPATAHAYRRRVFYVDEDGWQIRVVDVHDAGDQLWRVQEAHSVVAYDKPYELPVCETVYDLQSKRYLAQALNNEDPETVTALREVKDFEPGQVRGAGRGWVVALALGDVRPVDVLDRHLAWGTTRRRQVVVVVRVVAHRADPLLCACRFTRMLLAPMRTADSSPRWTSSYILHRGILKYAAAKLNQERFELIVVPMQTVQLLDSPGRAAFLRCAAAHLVPGGLLAMALADAQSLEGPGWGDWQAPWTGSITKAKAKLEKAEKKARGLPRRWPSSSPQPEGSRRASVARCDRCSPSTTTWCWTPGATSARSLWPPSARPTP